MTLNIHTLTLKEVFGHRRYLFGINANKENRIRKLGYFPYLNGETKKRIRERDNYTCQLCGEWGNNVDHIIPLRISHNNSDKNLRVLCFKCNIKTRLKRRDARPETLEDWETKIRSELWRKQIC